MSAIDFADGLNERKISFSLFRNALHQNDLAASLGWERTIDKLTEHLNSPKTSATYATGLEAVYVDLTLNGNKLIKVFKLLGDYDELIKHFSMELVEKKTIYDKRFPLPLEHDDLVAAPLTLSCADYYTTEDRSSFVFCSKQYVVEKEILPAESLTDNAQNDYGDFDEIYGVRKRAVQLFDVVCVDRESGTLQIRMDGLDVQKTKDIERRLLILESKVLQVIEAAFDVTKIISGAINFFPCIKKLYSSGDGRIAEIGHTTDSAGVHRGKMRTKQHDFRDDTYHAGGVAGIVELNPHMLSKCWNSPSRQGYVELVIPGTVALTSSANPTIDTAFVLSCASDIDYDFVMDKIFESMTP
ncbi:hypothetical protein [Pseudomonas sp. GL-RE-26]|uniref:hypothetical protein n=1 Tax=Pseudomonas sp. GL-RE-26 TaxID=2832390 RepID=UPI001CC0FECC|nr:hypothetical protein [Pseudomonas sp. GL-RE-26]